MAAYKLVGLSLGLGLLAASCSWLPFNKGCCEGDHALGLGYLNEADRFSVAAPPHGHARDVAPGEGETITKPGLLSKYNPLKGLLGDNDDASATSISPGEEDGFFRNLLPF